jgi:SAM-dependent methyltransferase
MTFAGPGRRQHLLGRGHLARTGLRAVALDISMAEMQGLRTADWWFEDRKTYFERVLAEMSALPFADDSFDWVFCCEVLHHDNRPSMSKALREIHRVLHPGGGLLVMNEPLRWPTDLKHNHGAEVAPFDGNEHVYFCVEYMWKARRPAFAASASPSPCSIPSTRATRSTSRSMRAYSARSSSRRSTSPVNERSCVACTCGGAT